MILLAQNPRWLAPPLVSRRTWYNDSANAESKAACAALQPLKRLIIPASHDLRNKCRLRRRLFLGVRGKIKGR